MIRILDNVIILLNPGYALGFVMKGQYAKIASALTRFYDEEIVNPILKNKIENPRSDDEYHLKKN